jgi:hypothetical protein
MPKKALKSILKKEEIKEEKTDEDKEQKEEKKEDDPFKNMNEEKLKKMSVIGKGGLRDFVVKNKIFKGIGNMKKQQFIDDILISKWWRDNIGVIKVDNMGGAETKKDTRGKRTKSLDESFKLRQKLQQDLQLCENRIKKKNKIIIDKDTEILDAKGEVDKLKEEYKKHINDMEDKKKADELKFEEDKKSKKDKRKKPVKKIKVEKEIQTDKEEKEEKRPDNINFDDEDVFAKLLPKISQSVEDELDELPPEIGEVLENNLDISKDKPLNTIETEPQPINNLDISKDKSIETQTEPKNATIETQTEPQPYTDGLITHKEVHKKNIDAGHTIVNVYCNGNNDPNLSIPQDVVRNALNVNNSSLYNQQEVIEWLKEYLENNKQQAPIYNTYYGSSNQSQPIQSQPIQSQPMQQNMGDIRDRFNKEPVKKWGDVKKADVLKSKTADEANVSKPKKDETKDDKKDEIKEEKKDEVKEVKKIVDDDEEEIFETDLQKRIRIEKEERAKDLATSISQSTKRGKSEKFRGGLSDLFMAGNAKKREALGDIEPAKPLVISKEPAKKWGAVITIEERKKLEEEALRKKLEE